MLRGIQKASSNWIGRVVMGVVLGLIAISFGIWGIGDIFRGFGASTVAKVGSTEIRIDTFRQLYQDRVQQLGRQLNRPVTPDQARALGFDRQVLYDAITEAALDERTRKLGLNVTEAEVARQITENPNLKGLTGQFDRLRFEQVLRNMGTTEQRFIADQRRAMLRQQLVGTIAADPAVPKTALEAFNRFQNEERTIEFVTLGAKEAGEVSEPTPEALNEYHGAHNSAFRAPEYRKLTIVTLTPDDIAARIEVSDADLKAAYAARRGRYETAERRHVKQIVFPNLDEAKAAAEKLAAGTSFEALAGERGLKDSDIDLGTVTKSSIVDSAVAEAAFGLQAGAVSAPIEGRFGIAIAKVETIEAAKVRGFEEVVDELKRDMQTERARNETTTVQEKVEDERLGGATLADAARKQGLKVQQVDAIDREGKDARGNAVLLTVPTGVDVLTQAFTGEVHGEHEPIRVQGNGGYVWYDVEAITPARERPLDEVRAEVTARWRDEQIGKQLNTAAAAMVEKIKAGTPFADAAGGLKVEWRPGLKRSGIAPGLGAAAITEVFKTSQGSAASVQGAVPTERIVFSVTEIKVPPLDADSADAKRIEDALKNRTAEDVAQQYLTWLQNDIGVTINQNALNQVSGSSQN